MTKSLVRQIAAMVTSRPIPFQDPALVRGSSLYAPGSGDKYAQLQAMTATGTLFAIVTLLSTGTSQHQWQMFKKVSDGRRRYARTDVGSDTRDEVLVHPALSLWNNPNPFWTGEEFREMGWMFMELVGEWYWILNRGPSGKGLPVEMWTVLPNRMEPVPDRKNFLAGWIYTGPNGEKVPLLPDEVIQLRYPHPTDFYRGCSPVQALLADIDSARYSAEWSRNFFLNSATPGGIVTFSKRLRDEEYQEWMQRWREQHQGISRGHRVGVLEQGATWTPNTYTIRDMQFRELRDLSREVMREAYRIHPSMLGLVEDVNRANAQTAEEVHIAWHEVPRLRRNRGILNNKLLPMYKATNVEFDFADPNPQNPENAIAELTGKANAAAVLVKAGWNDEDVLGTVGLPAMRFGGAPAAEPATRPALPPGGTVGAGDEGTAPDQSAFWNEIDPNELLEMAGLIRETFSVRSRNGHTTPLMIGGTIE